MGCTGCGRKYNPAWSKLMNQPTPATPMLPTTPRSRSDHGIIRRPTLTVPTVVPDEIKNYKPDVKSNNENT